MPDLPTAQTVAFIVSKTPRHAAILEIGCGRGEVAWELESLGYAVTAIDADADEVRIAQAKGVRAIVGEWPHVDLDISADVVVFTRSLHHVRDLGGSIDAAHRVLAGRGQLLIEDFDYTAADRETIAWLAGKVREADQAGILRPGVDEFAIRVAAASDGIAAWRTEHDHNLHDARRILSSVEHRFVIEEQADVPYIYRYLARILTDTPAATDWLFTALQEERDRGASSDLRLLGRRITAAAKA